MRGKNFDGREKEKAAGIAGIEARRLEQHSIVRTRRKRTNRVRKSRGMPTNGEHRKTPVETIVSRTVSAKGYRLEPDSGMLRRGFVVLEVEILAPRRVGAADHAHDVSRGVQ